MSSILHKSTIQDNVILREELPGIFSNKLFVNVLWIILLK
jgi:hypothetical protein